MYRFGIILMAAMLIASCNTAGTKDTGENAGDLESRVVSATIEELMAQPADYEGKEVAISGMVTHVCRHGGQKCFVLASDGETQIRIVPGGDIAEFDVALEGSTVAFKGFFRVLNPVEAEVHLEDHDSKAHHATEMAHSEAEKAEYFIEAVDLKEVTQ
jgi:hypothetical protein